MGIEVMARVSGLKPSFAENRAPSFSLGKADKAVIKNPFKTEVVSAKPELKVADVIAEAEAIIRQAQKPSVIARSTFASLSVNSATKQSREEIATLPSVARNDMGKQSYVRAPKPLVVWPVEPMQVWVPQQFRKVEVPKIETKPQVLVQAWPQLEPQPALKPQTESAVMFAQPKPLEQKNEEKKMQVQLQPEQKEEEETQEENEEETRKRFLRDDETLKVRLENLIVVISSVSENEEFTGEMLKRLMPEENTRLRSEVLKKYTHTATYETIVDGSYEEMLEAFGLLGKFRSKQEAYDKGRRVIEEKKPVRWGKDGTPVSRKDVDRVFKKHLVKPNFMEEVEKRNNKKAFQQAA